MRKVDFRFALFVLGRVGLVVAQRPSFNAMECVCLLPKQWPASCCWEEGDAEITPSRPTFLSFFFLKIKDCTFVASGPSCVRRNARVRRVCSRRRGAWCFWPAKRARCPRKHDGAAGRSVSHERGGLAAVDVDRY